MQIRQRFNKNAIDHAENRGIGADTERQGENAYGGKAGVAAQPADGVAQIGEGCRNDVLPTVARVEIIIIARAEVHFAGRRTARMNLGSATALREQVRSLSRHRQRPCWLILGYDTWFRKPPVVPLW